ncbi:hypothetical protein NsoK4_09265 [Nitrosopumilus sp. K4]|uniref:hypothetical protein n=1 Tax=Nitrosopumilus sp. K4 TaxID=2795383 RepID=UPI001BAB40EE|nr:hypothetical protein [Nitrosopumilus sp. K4]QUC64594.1 hypothetical protein NsoK4_09265 [Nitrosopumilus sp. K4]
MDPDEKIQAHLVSVWREPKKFFSIGGKEGMLVLTDKHLMFIHKTEAKIKWWQAITQRQVVNFIKSKNTMIIHDGYNEKNLIEDLENEKNIEISFDDITSINHEEKPWGSVLLLEYHKNGKEEKFQYSIAQDWVKYPAKEPTKYMKVDWAPFVQYIKDRQKFVE